MRKFLLSALAATLVVFSANATTDDFESWVQTESQISVTRLNANISPAGTRRGVILASPSTQEPNYYYYWVRDGALVMRAILDRAMAGDVLAQNQFKDWVSFTRENQADAVHHWGNLGEPRFNADGSVNTEPWGRPQNDGPAARALTLIRYANWLLSQGDRASVARDLYQAELPARSVIKTDLEYVAHHWQDRCIDLWEEVMGRHFFTEAIMMVSLREGAKLAIEMNDPQAAKYYQQVADQIEDQLAKHWDPSKGYYLSALEFSAGPQHQKPSQLDVSVLLAALFVEQPVGLLSLMDDHMIKSANALETAFASHYPINAGPGDLGTAIGRYTEDIYYNGNPWILTTVAFAEWHYRMAAALQANPRMILSSTQAHYFSTVVSKVAKKTVRVNAAALDADMHDTVVEALKIHGDAYLKRIRSVTGVTGHLAEQFEKSSGIQTSARDLSWSYAAFLRAAEAREELK